MFGIKFETGIGKEDKPISSAQYIANTLKQDWKTAKVAGGYLRVHIEHTKGEISFNVQEISNVLHVDNWLYILLRGSDAPRFIINLDEVVSISCWPESDGHALDKPASERPQQPLNDHDRDARIFHPFDKVLVRDREEDCWEPAIFMWLDADNENYPFRMITGEVWKFCIPYEGNEELCFTKNPYKVTVQV